MFHRILIPLAFTGENEVALGLGSEMASRDGAEVLLLHVVETVRGVEFDDLRDFYERLERRAQAELASTAERFREAEIPVRTDVTFGPRAEQIVAYAREHAVDLILLSSHRADADLPASLGTISHKVALFADCPVLLVK